MATGVILWHSWPLTGRSLSFEPAHQLLRDGFVDGFFAISGFLITWSWFRHPRMRDYLVARALRIMPGFWACLIVTAFVIAPISVAIQGGSAARLLWSVAPVRYVLANCALMMQQNDIAGTPVGVPWQGMWNGSLWTLFWEALCYIAIAVLGITGLLRRRWLIPALLALALIWSARLPALNVLAERPPDPKRPIDAATVALFMQQAASRFAVMFLAGALLFRFRHAIPARWSLVVVSLIIVAGSSLLPNYRLLGAVPLAYALIVSGALIRNRHLRLRTDLSYGVYIYAFPMQQLLIICGLGGASVYLFALAATVATLPLAALSWFVVEKRSLALKSRLLQKNRVQPAPLGPPG